MANIPDKTGRTTLITEKGKTSFFDSDINVYEWNIFPYNDYPDEAFGGKTVADLSGRTKVITDKVGRTKAFVDMTGRDKTITDMKQNSVTLWDDSVITWDSEDYSWDGYKI